MLKEGSYENCMKLYLVCVSICFDDLLDVGVADGALLVDDLGALLAQAAMAAWHHDCINLASHAYFAHVVLDVGHRWLLAHHLSWIDKTALRWLHDTPLVQGR